MLRRQFPLLILLVLPSLALLAACSVVPETSTQPGIALIYGAGDYMYNSIGNLDDNIKDNGSIDLSGPVNDANRLAAAYSKQGWDVRLRLSAYFPNTTNSDPSAQNAKLSDFRTQIALLANDVKPWQRVIIYYSGHGSEASANSQAALAFADYKSGTDAGLLTPDEMFTELAPILRKQALVTVVIDACFSGSFVADGAYANNLPANYGKSGFYVANPSGAAFGRALSTYFGGGNSSTQGSQMGGENLWVISAAGPAEESWEAGIKDQPLTWKGIFTMAFLDSFTYGDFNRDGAVTVYEAYRYAYKYLDTVWNPQNSLKFDGYDYLYLPHIYGNPQDLILYRQ